MAYSLAKKLYEDSIITVFDRFFVVHKEGSIQTGRFNDLKAECFVIDGLKKRFIECSDHFSDFDLKEIIRENFNGLVGFGIENGYFLGPNNPIMAWIGVGRYDVRLILFALDTANIAYTDELEFFTAPVEIESIPASQMLCLKPRGKVFLWICIQNGTYKEECNGNKED